MEERLRPGLTARVEVTVYEGRDVVLVPRVAIRREGERSMVRVAGRGGVEWREVAVGRLGRAEAEIVEGLAEGEVVVVE